MEPLAMALAGVGGGLLLLALLWAVTVGRRRARLDRDWSPDCAVIPTATFDGDQVTVHGVRHFVWRSSKDFDAVYADETYDLSELVGVWFVTCSFETRRTKGQRYHPWAGLWRGFELLLLFGGEEDLIRLRTNGRKSPVYLFPCRVPDGKGEALFRLLCEKANALAERPEFYNTLTTTCTTSLVQAVNKVTPGRIPLLWRTLLPGHSPRAAYRLGLIRDVAGNYPETLKACYVSDKARAHEGTEGFSAAIRAGTEGETDADAGAEPGG
jgi:hypothetical protein